MGGSTRGARTLSVAAAFSLLRHFERAQDHGEKVFFPDMYTPVGVDLGFNMTQRFIAVDDNVLFREALNKLIAALVNANYLEVSSASCIRATCTTASARLAVSYSVLRRNSRHRLFCRFCLS